MLLVTTVVDIRYQLSIFFFWTQREGWEAAANVGQKVQHDAHTYQQRVQNHNSQKIFLDFLLKQRKNQHPRRTTNKIWQMTSLRLKFFGNTKCKHSSKRSWNLMLMELKQVKIPVSLQLCKEISFVIFIFCALWKIIFWTWESWKKHNRLLPPKTGEHLLFLHHNLWKPE